MEKILVSIIIFLFLLIVALLFYKYGYKSFKILELNMKPDLNNSLVDNPDLVFPNSFGWLKNTSYNLLVDKNLFNGSTSWDSDGFVAHNRNPLSNRYGVVILHPIDVEKGRYIETSVSLPDDNKEHSVFVGLANAASLPDAQSYGYYNESSYDCVDVGSKIFLTDIANNKKYLIFNKTFIEEVGRGRWHDFEIKLGKRFNGKNVILRLESYASDAGCGLWKGEWLVVDYLAIK